MTVPSCRATPITRGLIGKADNPLHAQPIERAGTVMRVYGCDGDLTPQSFTASSDPVTMASPPGPTGYDTRDLQEDHNQASPLFDRILTDAAGLANRNPSPAFPSRRWRF